MSLQFVNQIPSSLDYTFLFLYQILHVEASTQTVCMASCTAVSDTISIEAPISLAIQLVVGVLQVYSSAINLLEGSQWSCGIREISHPFWLGKFVIPSVSRFSKKFKLLESS